MKALAWYTTIFSIVVILLFILLTIGLVPPPPLTAFEDLAWAVLTVPVVILGIMVIKKSA